MAEVVELAYYPVKGCGAARVREAELTRAGLAHDRAFMVITPDGAGRTQRRDPELALVRPEVAPHGAGGEERLTLSAPGHGSAHIPLAASGPRREVEMFGNPYSGVDQGDEAAAWFSDLLGAPSRLVRVPPEHDRVTDGQVPGTSGYADSCAVHMLSLASLRDLNDRLAAAGEAPMPMNRFRPNIVVDGWEEEPHAEDRVRRVTFGDAELGYAKLAIRCVVTTVEQRTGVKSGPEPLRALARYRRATGGGVAFGSKFAVLRTGALAVGDKAEVTAWADSEL
ncbi:MULTISPECIES: MOSC N-terminal beta barrel domain-containing protein [unclassified Streptomyces]|uniref:MOSC domain-containing protein n=1 Tax=unclassified Streptomyces TaxID=2593676 RepID=UPI002DDB479E|nr:MULTISPECIES: MOSC N-terminal beta barrel domain-containing protein [unclassified Streptomyces]WSA90878.1 MOSC N-terminal beta barrel domain-containing protein [Streptomyces sp. NBC_01795]WSB75200.1 MOSC N-terminal beta barrel domain-containing protein [Streptomyces sp. NBC_01775]WSS16516.1 MOSC N-terminal beta barrel domain-containing protein [Streptomyces sp. NBC_01186]WSS45333.1 MOSC N-terminal beta barrel domain-containing protein [Streptomyces sp. NBC_01187]